MRVFAQTLASPSAFAGSRIVFMFSSPVGLFFILSLALAFSPHLLMSTATRVPSPFEGTLGGLVPCPVPSHGCWARGGLTLRWESLQTYGFLGGRLAPWVGRAAELTPLLPPSHNQSQSSGAHSSWGCDRRHRSLQTPWSFPSIAMAMLPFEMKLPGERNQPVAPTSHILMVSPWSQSSRRSGLNC